MKIMIKSAVCLVLLIFSFVIGCGQRDVLSKMKNQIPIFEGAQAIESYIPEKNVGVIKMEIEVSKASQKEIFDFYKEIMTGKGWELKKLKDYGKNGSVMELVKSDIGTFSVMTIMKQTKKSGKIPITLNLTIN